MMYSMMPLAFARALGDFGVTIMIAGNIPGKTQTASVASDNEAFSLAVTVSAVKELKSIEISIRKRKFAGWEGWLGPAQVAAAFKIEPNFDLSGGKTPFPTCKSLDVE